MKVEIELVTKAEQEGTKISTMEITESVEQAKQLLECDSRGIPAVKDEKTYLIDPNQIYYAESIDNKCFIYTKDDCFEVKYKLYELEMILDYRFFRCSKSMICNMKKIRFVKAEYNAKMIATMLNGEAIVINRSYVKELKKRLGM